jgi:hypothetical protein
MAQVEGLTARQPVLMVVEDAQWRVVLNINLIRLFYRNRDRTENPSRTLKSTGQGPPKAPYRRRAIADRLV